MTGFLWVAPTKEQMEAEEEIKRLIANAKPMTAEDVYRQKRSWLIGEMGIEHPEWPDEQLHELVDRVMAEAGYVKPAADVMEEK